MRIELSRLSLLIMRAISLLAMMLAVQSVNATCFYCLHQPDIPESLQ